MKENRKQAQEIKKHINKDQLSQPRIQSQLFLPSFIV